MGQSRIKSKLLSSTENRDRRCHRNELTTLDRQELDIASLNFFVMNNKYYNSNCVSANRNKKNKPVRIKIWCGYNKKLLNKVIKFKIYGYKEDVFR